MKRAAWGAWMLPVLLVAPSAHAAPAPPVRLVYERAPGAELCPSPDAIRAAVAARLGFDPFAERAPSTVAVAIARRGGALEAHIELRDAADAVTGTRELHASDGDCEKLAAAVTLAISIAVDARSPRPAPRRAAPRRRLSRDTWGEPQDPESPAAPRPSVAFHTGAFVLGALGAAPRPAFGLAAYAGVRLRAFSFALEGRYDLPASMAVGAHSSVGASLLLGTFAPCVHGAVIVGCALVSAGVLRGASEGVPVPHHDATPFVALGGRFGVEVPLAFGLAARGHLDLLAPLTRTTLELDDRPVWRTPPVNAALGAGLGWSFP